MAPSVTFLLLLLIFGTAHAHPLGNFSVNHYSHLRVGGDTIAVLYIIDMAEIPTFQEIQEIDSDRDGRMSAEERRAYLARKVKELAPGLLLTINGRPLQLAVVATDLLFPPGAGGLPTMKIGVRYRARIHRRALRAISDLEYRDANFPDRAGWKEIVATEVGRVVLLTSSVPVLDRSNQLSEYPADIINSPPQDLQARLRFSRPDGSGPVAARSIRGETTKPAGASPLEATRRSLAQAGTGADGLQVPVIEGWASPGGVELADGESPVSVSVGEVPATSNRPIQTALGKSNSSPVTPDRVGESVKLVKATTMPRSAFTELITTKHLSTKIVLLSLLVAFALGAFHALEPGHGKTVVAAYLVGSKGTARHALLLGGIVTASHTFGVYLLGVVTLYMSRYILPERLYPWLGVASGLTIFGMGVALFFRYLRGGHSHAHGHEGGHHHGTHYHSHHQGGARHDHGVNLEHSHDRGGDLLRHRSLGIERRGVEVSYRDLFALGITGGIIPCPAALVVLLSAISLGRVGFGLILIIAFSVGLALVLMAIGLLMVYARGLMAAWSGEGHLIQRLPLLSSVVIVIFGCAIALQALIAGGVIRASL